ncbi:MAG TPA: hypothetical protein VKQ36_04945 [Ktedonobacterales bacterium]|nr:hypothetical protein [Ktedonobacterales bacterium]
MALLNLRRRIFARLPMRLVSEGEAIEWRIREGRFQRGLALISALSGLLGGLEVTLDHYKGSYSQRVMYSPLILSPLLTIAGVWGAFNRRVARTFLPLASLALLVDGVVGWVFHMRGIARKPGGWRLPVMNIAMGPPLLAPLLLGIGGFLGLIASLLRREDDPPLADRADLTARRPSWLRWAPAWLARDEERLAQDVREGRFQRLLAGATGVFALLNGLESLYSHYQNNYAYRIQWTPIVLSPLIAMTSVGAIVSRRVARWGLPLVSALAVIDGMLGSFYHLRGVLRRPGGLKTPAYNLLYGPPLFAPMLYAATGMLGLLASLLRREK